jgi:hypothetical protein
LKVWPSPPQKIKVSLGQFFHSMDWIAPFTLC